MRSGHVQSIARTHAVQTVCVIEKILYLLLQPEVAAVSHCDQILQLLRFIHSTDATMPRRRQDRSIKQKLRQDTLDTFVGSSSPIPADTHAKTPSPARKIRQARTTTLPSRDRQDRSQAKADTNNDPDEGSESSDVAAIHFEPQVIDLTEEEDEPAPVRPIAQKRKTRIRRAGSEEHSVSSQEAAVGVPVIWKGRKASGKRRLLVSTDDEDKSEPRYKQRKLIKGVRPPSPEADELGLMDEVDENSEAKSSPLNVRIADLCNTEIIESRLRTRAKKSTFQKNLEKLKRQHTAHLLVVSVHISVI